MSKLWNAIGTRLVAGYLLLVAVAVGAGLVGYVQVNRVNDILAHGATERAEARYLTTKVRVEVLQVSSLVEHYVAAETESERARLATELSDAVLVTDELVHQITSHAVGSEEEAQHLFGFGPEIETYMLRGQAVLAAYDAEGQAGEQTQDALAQFAAIRDQLLESLTSFEGLETTLLYRSQEQAREVAQSALSATVILSLVALVGGVVLGLALSATITRPVGRLVEAARRVAAGELTPIEVRSRTEIGVLARVFNDMAIQLRESIGSLERRVAERTAELERRSRFLEASAEVARASSSILDAERLIRQVVDLVRERFGLYYVGLFLVDEAGEWAVLRAGTGEAGRTMLARGHRLRIGGGSMIGWCVANARARIALRAGEDPERLATPELPDTRSEAALPLRSRGRVIGALTVQSDQPGAFDEDTIAVLQTMADQVAVALDNAALFAQSQEAAEAARRAYGELSRRAWAEMLMGTQGVGYRADESGVSQLPPVHPDSWEERAKEAWRTGHAVYDESAAEPSLALPLRVREEIIGVLEVAKPRGSQWTRGEVAQLETLVDQLGMALENARLLEETQQRVEREQILGQLSARFTRSLEVETVLQSAVQELGQILHVAEVAVYMMPAEGASPDGDEGV